MSDSKDIVQRLRGEYRIPITDGHGAAGGDEPDNQNEFVRHFETPPIQKEAADRIEALEAEVEKFKEEGFLFDATVLCRAELAEREVRDLKAQASRMREALNLCVAFMQSGQISETMGLVLAKARKALEQ